jgi:PAS domain S-box-containing protein
MRHRWLDLPLAVKGRVVVGLPMAMLVVTVGFGLAVAQEQRQANEVVARTVTVQAAIEGLFVLLVDAETGVRGYLLTEDEAFLEPYDRARTLVEPEIERLRALVADQAQLDRVDTLAVLVDDRLAILGRLRLSSPEAPDLGETLHEGKALSDQIRALVAEMNASQQELLSERTERADTLGRWVIGLNIAAGLVGLVGGLLVVGFFTSAVTRRISALEHDAHAMERGELVTERGHTGDEIGNLGRSLRRASELLVDREVRLGEATAFLQNLLDASPVVTFRRAAGDGALTYVSPNAERVVGVAADRLTSDPLLWPSSIHPEDLEAFALGSTVEAKSDLWEERYRFLAGDGSVRWLETTVKREEEGTLLGFGLDVTARREAEHARDDAERSYRMLVEHTPTAVARTTRDGRFAIANPAMARMLGYPSPEELIADVTNMTDLYVDPDDRRKLSEKLAKEGVVEGYELTMRRRDGSTIDVMANVTMIIGDDGTPAGVEAVAVDVTQRKEAEREAREARLEAERANQAKSEFMSRMSHELRTPLNSIIGFAQLLEFDDLTDTQQDSVTHVLKAGHHLLGLINEVLDIARIEAGRLNLSMEPVPLRDTLTEVVDLIRPIANRRQVEIHIDKSSDCRRHVFADHQRLKQALLNLVSNAVKYNRVAGRVTVGCESGEEGRLRISVADTGSGISPEMLERIFTPFDRLGAGGSSEEGSGLGLVLSRHLIEAMGGTLEVESEVGVGSTFTLTLALAASPLEQVAGTPTSVSTLFRGSGPRRTVLYIEDNLSNLTLVQRILAHRPDVHLVTAMQGTMGIDLAREHRPDLVLLDLDLPDISGRNILTELRLDHRTAHIPIVIVSADASPAQVRRLIESGARAYLTKPLDVAEFLAVIDDILGDQRLALVKRTEPL